MQKVKDILPGKKTVSELLGAMKASGGFQAAHLGKAAEIFAEAIKEKRKGKCKIFLSFPACIVSTGTRGILAELVRRKLVDVIITASGTVDHDLARLYSSYYHGSFIVDDAALAKKNIHRLGNIFIPQKDYGIILEKVLQPMLKEINRKEKELSTYQLLWKIASLIKHSRRKESILWQAYKNSIPIILPGPYDGAFGYQLWQFQQDHKLKLNLFEDEQLLSELVWNCKKNKIKTAALCIGGGISKHHTIWWNQFKDGLDYAIYITTAIEEDGSLSGAKTKEALSWHKIARKGKHVTVTADATIALPLLVAAVLES